MVYVYKLYKNSCKNIFFNENLTFAQNAAMESH